LKRRSDAYAWAGRAKRKSRSSLIHDNLHFRYHATFVVFPSCLFPAGPPSHRRLVTGWSRRGAPFSVTASQVAAGWVMAVTTPGQPRPGPLLLATPESLALGRSLASGTCRKFTVICLVYPCHMTSQFIYLSCICHMTLIYFPTKLMFLSYRVGMWHQSKLPIHTHNECLHTW
jgi:hypothetical protein